MHQPSIRRRPKLNFLAHLCLCAPDAETRLGSLFPDLGRPSDLIHPSKSIQDAIAQHQAVDALTDQHPAHTRLRAMLRPSFGRLAGVVADVLLDHELAADWQQHRKENYDHFCQHVYRQLTGEAWRVSTSVARTIERMVEGNWLGAYRTTAGMEHVLGLMSRRISQRFGQSIDLTPAAAWIVPHRAELSNCFRPLWTSLLMKAAPRSVAGVKEPADLTSGPPQNDHGDHL